MNDLAASVVVATRNRPERLRECLESLARQSLPGHHFELLVVDDASDPSPAPVLHAIETLAPDLRIDLVTHPHRMGMAVARNSGLARARGRYVFFIDDDAVAPPTWLEAMLAGFGAGTEALGGGWLPYQDGVFALYDRAYTLHHYGARNQWASGPGGQNMAFSRRGLVALGGFDPRFEDGADDADLNLRARERGLTTGFCDGASVRHWSAVGIGDFCRKRYGRGRAGFSYHHKYLGGWALLRGPIKLAAVIPCLPVLVGRAMSMAWRVRRPLAFPALLGLSVLDWTLGAAGEIAQARRLVAATLAAFGESIRRYGRRNGAENFARIVFRRLEAEGTGDVTLVGPRFTRSYGRMMDEIHDALLGASLLRDWLPGGWSGRVHAPWILVQDRELHPLLPRLPGGALRPRIILKRECPHADEVAAVLQQEARLRGVALFEDAGPERERARIEYRAADHLLTPSRFVRDTFIRAGHDATRIAVIPPGVDHRRYHRRGPPAARLRTFLFLGLLGLRKGVLPLVEAWVTLKPRRARLLLAGSRDPAVFGLIRPHLGMAGISYVGRPTDRQVMTLYQASHAFCLPSRADGFGLAALEAMACEVPVLVSDRTGLAEHVTPASGVVVPSGDRGALIEGLERLLAASPDELQAMGRAAREATLGLTWARYRESVRGLVAGLLAATSGPDL